MGRLGQKKGSALHRGWREHDKPKIMNIMTYEHSKRLYDERKEMKALEKQVKEIAATQRLAK